MPKNSYVMPAIILALICLVTTGLLSLTYSFTFNARQMQAGIAAKADRQAVFPDAAGFAAVEGLDLSLYEGLDVAEEVKDAGGKVIGHLIVAHYRGYGGDVQVMIAFGPDARISRLKVLTNDETPGLGKKVEKDAFIGQFAGQGPDKELSVKPSDSGKYIIDAVSGATISSRAVTEAVNIALRLIRQINPEVK
jgi:Na+-translocating ferredoxin:NAD+ oxidoreductase subunit G